MDLIVQNALAPFQRWEFNENKTLKYDIAGYEVNLTQGDYVWYYYQSYETDDMYDIPMTYAVLKLATGETPGKYYDHISLTTNVDKGTERMVWLKHTINAKDTFSLNQLALKIIQDTNTNTATGASILTISMEVIQLELEDVNHRNAMIFCKGNDRTIHAYIYEPHGYMHNLQIMHKTLGNFTELLVREFNNLGKTLKVAEMALTCPIGLQSKRDHNGFGLCVMFSYLWVYVVFKLVAQKVSLIDAVKHAETLIFQQTKQGVDIVSTVFNFALSLIDTYMSSIPNSTYFADKARDLILYDIKLHDISEKPVRKQRSPLKTPPEQGRLKYGHDCKSHDDCETSFCNPNNTCDHNPLLEDAPELIDAEFMYRKMQLFIESGRDLGKDTGKHLNKNNKYFYEFYDLLTRPEQDFLTTHHEQFTKHFNNLLTTGSKKRKKRRLSSK